jgi:succinate dehydrogenase hydrophobic anchor subunit
VTSGVSQAKDWWARAVIAVVLVACVGFTVVYVSISEGKWCDLMATLDNPVPAAADNPQQQVAAQQIKDLRHRLGC